jgi:lipopolysaccharide/colanic/teichoic acid biosynthesis glycosyltransferase
MPVSRLSRSHGVEFAFCELHSASEFRRILRRERLLADRFGGGFSLLTFAPGSPGGSLAALAQLAQCLKPRLRFTDEAGWVDAQCTVVGVVMHRTPAAAAWKVADEVCEALPAAIPPPLCEVYYYPLEAAVHERRGRDTEYSAGADGKAVRPMDAMFALQIPLWKRCLDVSAAAVALLLLSPLLLLAAVIVKLTSAGPIFFRQWRTGLGGKRFEIYKFRSMSIDAEEKKRWLMAFNEQDGPAFKIVNDPRITAIGHVLRRTNIDELPQLWNILKADMSIVGPRPLPCSESEACSMWHKQRLDVTPGLTCIWQVRGTRDSFDDWVRMDIEYTRQRSPWFDLKLILSTIPIVLLAKRRG